MTTLKTLGIETAEEAQQLVTILSQLRAAFPPEQVGLLPASNNRPTLEYVGHGAVTARLLDVDPLWTWEPVATDEPGRPLFDVDADGNPVGLWIRLTVHGITRLGYGSCKSGQFDAEKVLIGDALRNAAMRFGVALDLWIRGHGEDDEQVAAKTTGSRRSSVPVCELCDKSLAGAAVRKHGQGFVHQECWDKAAAEPEGAF